MVTDSGNIAVQSTELSRMEDITGEEDGGALLLLCCSINRFTLLVSCVFHALKALGCLFAVS